MNLESMPEHLDGLDRVLPHLLDAPWEEAALWLARAEEHLLERETRWARRSVICGVTHLAATVAVTNAPEASSLGAILDRLHRNRCWHLVNRVTFLGILVRRARHDSDVSATILPRELERARAHARRLPSASTRRIWAERTIESYWAVLRGETTLERVLLTAERAIVFPGGQDSGTLPPLPEDLFALGLALFLGVLERADPKEAGEWLRRAEAKLLASCRTQQARDRIRLECGDVRLRLLLQSSCDAAEVSSTLLDLTAIEHQALHERLARVARVIHWVQETGLYIPAARTALQDARRRVGCIPHYVPARRGFGEWVEELQAKLQAMSDSD